MPNFNILDELASKISNLVKNKDAILKLHQETGLSTSTFSLNRNRARALSVSNEDIKPQGSEDKSLEQQLLSWLSKLKLLSGVPFSYLVADEKLLPQESIRFFYLDYNWITALIDGACNLAGSNDIDHAHLNAFAPSMHAQAKLVATNLRSLVFKSNAEMNPVPKVITGFLLRSEVISNWPGLEVHGYQDQEMQNELQKLRYEHLSSDITLCLFAGEITSVKFTTPPESLHFGFDITADNKSLTKSLKEMSNTNPEDNGKLLNVSGSTLDIDSKVFRKGDKNVLCINALAKQIEAQLKTLGKATAQFTSAEFGFQMTVGVDAIVLSKSK